MMFVPNGIDTNVFYPNEEERRRVRAQWNMGDDVKIVGNISRFDPIKNHKMFLKAAAGSPPNGPTFDSFASATAKNHICKS